MFGQSGGRGSDETAVGRLMMNIVPLIKKKKKKGRQGRSAEVRARIAQQRHLARQWFLDQGIDPDSFKVSISCEECRGTDTFVEDSASGDVVCTDCGTVNSQSGLGFSCHAPSSLTICSKPYQRVVHFRQRLAQVLCRDPKQPKKKVNAISKYGEDHPELGNPQTWGYKTYSKICKALGYKTKDAEHWMQFRKRCGIWPWCTEELLPDWLVKILIQRFIIISWAFDYTLLLPRSVSENATPQPLARHNIVNINYLTPCLIRMESEEIFREIAKFFPQMISQDQPAKNNKRMKIMLDKCQESFSRAGEGGWDFDWTFKPITEQEILDYFTYFQ